MSPKGPKFTEHLTLNSWSNTFNFTTSQKSRKAEHVGHDPARETEEAESHWRLLLVMSGTGRWNELYVWLMLDSTEKLVSKWVSIQLQMHFMRLLSHLFPVLTLSSNNLLCPLSAFLHCFYLESSFRHLCLSNSSKVESLLVLLVRL